VWPTNEAETIELFKVVQSRLGWRITFSQGAFPDAIIESDDGDRLTVEFEYLSRNFERHGHDPGGCDLLICWVDNWPDAPLPVQALADCADAEAGAISAAICEREGIWQAKIERWQSEAERWRNRATQLQAGLGSLRQGLLKSAERAKQELMGPNPLIMLNDEAFRGTVAAVYVRVLARLDAQLADFD